ncbi:MAG: hypothetical protein WB952_11795 [Terriglobales bacterium]
MVDDPKWELAILATVQGFYEKLLQEPIGGEVPVPACLEAVSLQDDSDVHQTLAAMYRWLRLLDMAISPAMLRRAFTPETDPEIAEAMLRYFTRKKDTGDSTRDKTDLVATFLYRHPRVSGQWEQRGYGLDGSLPLSPFEIALIEILADGDVPSLSDEQAHLLRQFDRLLEETESFRDLNALLESGIILRVRELKSFLDSSFYHPGVLATIAPYNTVFGRKFDQLFMQAAAEIKGFAEALAEQGGSILGNVDGTDVTVEHVAALKESELLRIDYGMALEKFRRVSKLRRTLEQRPPIRRVPKPTAVRVPANLAPHPIKVVAPARPVLNVPAMREAVTPQQISAEESKLRRVEESVRVFVRVADPRFRLVVPMRFFNLILTPAEADAYCADYLEEKSLRADMARALLRMVAVVARMTTELEELRRAESSPSLWKLHADSLVTLLEIERSVSPPAERLLDLTRQNGDAQDVEAIEASLKKLHDCTAQVLKTLTTKPAEKVVGATSGK